MNSKTKVDIVTVWGTLSGDKLFTNAGIIDVCNPEGWMPLTGYWILLGGYYIKGFVKDPKISKRNRG